MAGDASAQSPPLSMGLFFKYGVAGALGCSITHSAVVPLDVVKTRLQTNPGAYTGMFNAFSTIASKEGPMMLLQGLGPTAVGYALQGFLKFGFYELFKKKYAEAVGPENAIQFRIPIWLAASATAETIADLALCPNEAVRIRLVAEPSFAKTPVEALGKIVKSEGVMGLYKGLPPILLKQVPYTMAKFAVFEFTAESVYTYLAKNGTPKESMTDSQKLTVSLGSGIVSGVVAAIVSQPADTVLSLINKEKTDGGVTKAIGNIMRRLGVSGLFLGVGTRCFMVGTLTAGQFFIYDGLKQILGITPAKK
ncbi:mitochondrial substrate carrier family protein [Cavenderia fasciculata]|uniref:Mitochondrial substrate carrier family protein n=1 Tax=Cavenderia fasciculata TaxID=261658 RepID=F4PSN1_CACFS|nr:mitochondrial substrate carrier family protein [Cavenderia fasciculata]EGG20723.1 mitochondrial substrate carrier family protein [Cavenderia fasciculata]|eukprot:XP_004358573.1 mitochondrial substrate carrier family protein [Cavenderia fasciculata]